MPFFQGVSYDATFESVDVPEEVRQMAEQRRQGARRDDVEFTFTKGRWGHLGEATLMNRVKSHPDVGERWYPDLLKAIREQQALDKQRKESEQQDKTDAKEVGKVEGAMGLGTVDGVAAH